MAESVPSLPELQIQHYLPSLRDVIDVWNELALSTETKSGLNEGDARDLEKEVIGNLIEFLEANPGAANNSELRFLIENYLHIGDCCDLAQKLASLSGFKYYDPLGGGEYKEGAIVPGAAANKVLVDIGEDVPRVDKTKLH